MKIKLFENFNQISLDITYELYNLNKFDEEEEINTDNYLEYNPYDLEDMVKLYLILKEKYSNIFIKKVTREIIDYKTIEKIKLKLDSKKYNL